MLLLLFSFCVSPAGCHVFLPGGAELLFPPGCLLTTTRLEWDEKTPEKTLVHLEEHEILLSCPLELRPHGIKFLKVCVEALKNYIKKYVKICRSSYLFQCILGSVKLDHMFLDVAWTGENTLICFHLSAVAACRGVCAVSPAQENRGGGAEV